MTETRHEFWTQVMKTLHLNYLQVLPEGYEAGGSKKWPLVIFLHGRGERGDDLELVKKWGLPKVLPELTDFPALVIVPQCPQFSAWDCEVDAVLALLDHLEKTLAVDADRIYLTGFSMGATGTWVLAATAPARFAALVPVCGMTQPARAPAHKHIPTWIFHGAKDEAIAIRHSDEMYEALRALGGSVQYTIYHDSDHFIADEVYRDPELYKWLFAQHRDPLQGGR